MYSSNIPIDIPCGKLIDWLVQHRHCKRDWGENLASIRRKIKSALKDMPESEEIKQLLVGSKLDYFKSKEIVQILKTTEADSKNIFGYYSSQRMKDWQDIVNSYEKDYVYVAEIATDLIRETNYEVPGVRRAIQNLHKERDAAEKERANLLRRQQQFNSEYQKLAQTYGIKGLNVIEELQDQSKNVTNVMHELVELSKSLETGVRFYREHVKPITELKTETFLSTLEHVLVKGNSTVYELKYKEAPEKIEVEDHIAPSISSGGNLSEIELVTDEIDFGEDVPSSSESSSGFVHVEGKVDDAFVKVQQIIGESNDKVARGDEAKLVLEYRKTRDQFLNNLCELDRFYRQCIADDQKESMIKFDKKDAEKVVSTVQRMIDIFDQEKNRVLFQMIDCPSFISNLNDKFVVKSKQASDSLIKAEQAHEKMGEIENQIAKMTTHLKKSLTIAKQLQSRVEESISEIYSGRRINIMGCAN